MLWVLRSTNKANGMRPVYYVRVDNRTGKVLECNEASHAKMFPSRDAAVSTAEFYELKDYAAHTIWG
jgi:hypothetical protein